MTRYDVGSFATQDTLQNHPEQFRYKTAVDRVTAQLTSVSSITDPAAPFLLLRLRYVKPI
jgi:hypothetical protein